MNVKIDHTGLRFRITAEELTQLSQGETLRENLQIGVNQLKIAIISDPENTDLTAVYEEDSIRLLVSPERIETLEKMGRSREGLIQERDGMILSLQVDFRTQKRQSVRA